MDSILPDLRRRTKGDESNISALDKIVGVVVIYFVCFSGTPRRGSFRREKGPGRVPCKGKKGLQDRKEERKEGPPKKAGERPQGNDSGFMGQRLMSYELVGRALEGMSDAWLVVAFPGGKVLSCNAAAERLFGVKAGESTVGDFLENVPPEGGRYIVRGRGGEEVELVVSPAEAAGQSFAVMVGRVVEKGEADADRLRYMAELAENIEAVLWLRDMATGRYVYISPQYERIWGCPVRDLYERPSSWKENIHEEDRERVESALARQKSGDYDVEYRIVRPDGEVRWVRSRAFLVRDADGEVRRIAGIVMDITEEKELRQRVMEALRFQEMEEALALFAHDLNNYLLFLEGRVKGLSAPDGSCPPEARDILRRAKMLRRMFDRFRRRSRGKGAGKEIVDVHELLESELSALKGVKVESSLEAEHHYLAADPSELVTVFSNLLRNALEATEGQRERVVSVRTRNAEIALDEAEIPFVKAGEAIVVEVRDNGPGIPPDIEADIFRPRFSTKEKGMDSVRGMGLFSVRKTVGEYGGFVEMKSAPGEGTTFLVHLPVAEAVASPHPAGEALPAVRGKRELVLGKGKEEAARLKLLLSGSMLEADTAGSAAEGLRKLAEEKYDTVLASGQMGREALERIAARVEKERGARLLVAAREEDLPEAVKRLVKAGKAGLLPPGGGGRRTS